MVQGEGTNPQVGKVTVDEFAARIKEKYPEYQDVDNLTLAKAIVEKYPEYEPVVSFEPIDVAPLKKKEGVTPSASLGGESPSTKSKDAEPTIGDWWGDKWNSLVEGVSDFMYHFSRETGASQAQIQEFVELSKDKYPELYKQYTKNYNENSGLGYSEEQLKKLAAVTAYTNYWEKNPEIDNEVVPYIRQRRRELAVEDTGVKIDEAVQKKLDERFVSSAISGLAASIPAMVTSASTLGGSFMTTSYYAADEELKRTFAENPNLEMTAGEQEAYKVTVAGIEGILEKVGLSGALKGNPLIKKVLTGKVFTRLANMVDEPTAEVFEKVVKEEIGGLESYIKKVSMGSLSEFETGSLQQLSVDVINELTNAMKGQEIFSPKTAIEIIEDALYAGAQEAVGGGVISGTVGAFSNDNIVTQEDFDKAELLVNNIDEVTLKKYLDKRVSAGEISQGEADNILQTAKEFKDVYSKIPQGVGPDSRRRMYQLINQKMQLRRSIEGKDEAIRSKVEQDIKKIDQEIVNLYEEKNMTPEQRKEAGITEETLDDPNLDPYANLVGKDANDFYSKFSEEDRQKVTDLNKSIRGLYDEYSKAETDTQKLEIRQKISDLRNQKVSIESKYDDSKKEAGVPSTQQEGQAPIQEQPIQEGGVEAPPTGGVVQEARETEVALVKEERAKPEYVVQKVSALPVEDTEQLTQELEGEFGLLTGENPMAETMTEEENAALNQRAELWLRAKGYSPRRVSGKYGQAENSFFVPGLTKEDAIAFAKEFNQESVAHSEGLIYQDGSMNPRVKEDDNFSFSEFNNDSDFVSVVNTADGPKTFQVGYDFDTKVGEAPAKEAPAKKEAPKKKSKADTLKAAERGVQKFGEPFTKLVDNFNNLLSKLGGSNIPVYVVDGNTYKAVTGTSSRGTFRTIDGQRTIVINADKATLGTVYHEMMHGYIVSMKLTPRQIVSFVNTIKTELKKGNATERKLADQLERFQKEYIKQEVYGKGLTLDDPNIAEEFAAEFVAQIKDNVDIDQMSVSTIDKIRLAVAKFINKTFKVNIDTTPIESRQEAFDFMNGFLDALEGRIEVEPKEDQGESGQVGTISIPKEQLEVVDAPKASEDPRGFIRKFVTDIKLATLKGRKFVTNMYDYTNAGLTQLGNGLSIELFGGRNYVALMLERNGKELGEVSNLAAFNTKSQAEGFIRNAKEGKADLFAPHAGTLTDSWQFQHHIFDSLVNLVLDNKVMSKARLIDLFNDSIKNSEKSVELSKKKQAEYNKKGYYTVTSKGETKNIYKEPKAVLPLKDEFITFAKVYKEKTGKNIKNFSSFKKDPAALLELLNAENNYSPDLRKLLNQRLAASKEFQKAIGIKNLNEFYALIADPMNQGISGGEIMTFVEFDPDTFEIVKTKPGDANHHPSFGWVVMAKIKRILQPEKYYKSYDLTEEYTKYNVSGPEVSTKEDPKFAVSNVTSSAGAIPKVAKVVSREQIDFEGSEMINEFSWTEEVWDANIGRFGGMKSVKKTEKSNKPIGIRFPDGTTAVVRTYREELEQAKKFVKDIKKGVYPYADEGSARAKRDILALYSKKSDFAVELFAKDGGSLGTIKLANDHFNYYFPHLAKEFGEDYKKGLIYTADNRRTTDAVFVEPEYRGKGYGARLYHSALRLLREQVPGARIISNHDMNVSKSAKNFWRGHMNQGLAKVILNTATPKEIEEIGGPETLKQLKDIGMEYTGDIYELLDPTERTAPSEQYDVVSEDVARQQIDWQASLFGKGQVNPAIVNRNDVVQEAAYDLLTGKITNAEYQEVVRITQSIDPITQFFLPASTKDMADALDSNKGKLLNVQLEDGTEVGLRLDIPAYKNRNIWVVSIHDSGKAGKSLSYGSVAWATDVTFGSNPKVAAFIAAGQNLDTGKKQDKTTIARMHGKWKNFEGKTKEERDASAVKKVEEIVAIENSFVGAGRKGSPWRQIGMNPFRHSYFYDRRTGKPVIAAAEVVQIGGLVYAKDVVYADKNDPIFEVTGYKDANGDPVRFQLEDQVKEERSNEEIYESVEKNQKGLFDADLNAAVDNDVANSASWQERPRTLFEKFVDLTRLKIQDKFRNLIKIQEDIEYSAGKPVGLDEDFRNAEALMHGAAKEELNKTEDKVGVIAKLIKASGLTLERFNDLLYAMHAQERNRYLRVISTDVGKSLMDMRKKLKMKPSEVAELLGITTEDYNKIEDNKIALKTSELRDILLIYGTTPSRFFYDNAKVKNGSGMTDVEAREILASYGLDLASPDVSQLKPRIRIAVQAVRDLTADTRRRLVEGGLETQDTIDAFNETYKNYVPLRGFAEGDVDSEIIEGGRKIEVRGREKRAKGRETKADSPLTQAIIANTTTIIRAEKNNVMTRFFNLAKNNPNKDVYEIIDPAITKEYKRELRSGKIITTAKTVADYMMDPKMVAVRIDGEYKFIRFKDQRLADAFRGANVKKADWMVKYLGQFNRALSSFITTYDPEFVLRNFSRDIQTAVLNLFAEQEISEGLIKDKNIVANVVADTLPALKSIFAVEGGVTGKKKASKNKEMDQYYREFKEDGARTEWFYSKSASEVQKDIEKLLEGKGEGSLAAALNLVERINSSVENAVRLSSYVNARKAGIPRAKAAELAKNLTVNFNKSGEWGQIGNTLYLFFNASVQGTSRLVRSLKPRYIVDSEGNRKLQVTTAQKMAIGLTIMGSLMSLLNEGLSDDDDDDKSFYSKIPDFEKERNIIIMKPNGKDYWKIPLPYGVNVFYVAGTSLADAAQKIKTPGEALVGIMEAAVGSFSPINFPTSSDFSKFVTKFITPTIGQIPAALAMNENYFGQTIYNKNFPFDTSPKPDSELGRKGGYRWTKELTRFLNKVSGGSEFRSGAIDINPDRIDFVLESLTGGMGKFVTRSANVIDKAITGNWDELEARQVPFLRVFYGQSPKYANLQEFYSRSVLVNQMQEEVKAKIITGPEAKRVSKMFYLGKNIRKRLSEIKKKEDAAKLIKDPVLQEERLDALEKLRYKLVADYNKQYERFEIDKLK